jgi:hypothetical protein
MQEKLLHFLWQYQYYSPDKLVGISGEKVHVLDPGNYNENAGPDFLHSTVMIDGIAWKGHVEIHVKSSDWNNHRHYLDPVYNSVILHVVWEYDIPAYRSDTTPIMTIELAGKVPHSVVLRYQDLSHNLWHIACSGMLTELSQTPLEDAKKSALHVRMEQKARIILQRLKENKGDWEFTTYQWLIRYFGFGKNIDAFDRLGKLLPYTLILRHRSFYHQVEALLFGSAGFLEGHAEDTYHLHMKNEFGFLKDKYRLNTMSFHEWKFLRMRPANFPTVRLAQLTSLFTSRQSLFATLMDSDQLHDIHSFFDLEVNEYWRDHYVFGKRGKSCPSKIGKEAIESLVINVLAPLKAAYRISKGQNRWYEVMESMLKEIPPENNRYIRLWESQGGIHAKNALDSQALLAQYILRCKDKKCLSCPVGMELLKETA